MCKAPTPPRTAAQRCPGAARAIHSPSMLSAQIWKPSSLEISNTRPFLGFFSVMLSLRFCSCCSQSMSGELKPPSSSSAAFGSARESAERQRLQQQARGAQTTNTIAKPAASRTGIIPLTGNQMESQGGELAARAIATHDYQ